MKLPRIPQHWHRQDVQASFVLGLIVLGILAYQGARFILSVLP